MPPLSAHLQNQVNENELLLPCAVKDYVLDGDVDGYGGRADYPLDFIGRRKEPDLLRDGRYPSPIRCNLREDTGWISGLRLRTAKPATAALRQPADRSWPGG